MRGTSPLFVLRFNVNDYAAFVRILGPSFVIATVCSKCAASDPSAVTTVHLSPSVRVA